MLEARARKQGIATRLSPQEKQLNSRKATGLLQCPIPSLLAAAVLPQCTVSSNVYSKITTQNLALIMIKENTAPKGNGWRIASNSGLFSLLAKLTVMTGAV